MNLGESAGWFLPHKHICWVSERHNVLVRDNNGRLHCEDGPSVMYPDGWAIYAWHGVRVPSFVIETPEQITIDHIRSETNQEVRRVMIERMGWDRFSDSAAVKVLSSDTLHARFPALPVSDLIEEGQRFVTSFRTGEEQADLIEISEFKDFESRPLRFVRVTDPSTGRRYIIRVAHNCKTPYEGVGASFGMTEKQYKESFLIRQGDVLLKPLANRKGIPQHS